MSSSTEQPSPDRRELADLSALADGTLDPARRQEVADRIAASPELSALYERERRVVAMLHQARVSERAPAGLRQRIDATRPSRAVRSRRRVLYGGGLAGALAVIALALALILPGSAPLAPSVSQAAALALRGPAGPPPAPDPSAPSVKLGRDVQEVYFPNWERRFGWVATGQRSDVIGGRSAATVYYRWHARDLLAYTIVSAPALGQPAASVRWLNGTELRTLTIGGRLVVTWRRAGHTCVLSATGVPASVLQMLASWQAPGLERVAS